jgi:hypothetical protein
MLDRFEPSLNRLGLSEVGEKLRQRPLGPDEIGLVVPEGVVGIEADEADRHY